MSKTIHRNAFDDEQDFERAVLMREYEYFQRTCAKVQAESDAVSDAIGLPREDIAWKRAMERAQRRAMPRWNTDESQRLMQLRIAIGNYSQAIGEL